MNDQRKKPPTASGARPRRVLWKRVLAVAIGYALVEVAVMPLVAAKAPLRLRARLPSPMYILGEPSKAGFLPRDYVLVLGDSYAEGYGDWLAQALQDGGNPPFQATDLVHESTGRDVVTFGRGGAGNVSAVAYLVQKRFAALRRVGFGEPSDVFVYVYEGNDLHDNLQEAGRHFGLGGRSLDSYADEELDSLIAARARQGFWQGLAGTLFVPYTLLNAAKGKSGGLETEPRVVPWREVDEAGSIPAYNVMRAGEQRYFFDGPAESPPLTLADDELALSLRLLESSLRWAMRRFDDSTITVVYLPAPLTCYEILSPTVFVKAYEKGRERTHPAAAVRRRSGDVRSRIRELAARLGTGFVDATEALQAAGEHELVHGPDDGYHFNRTGYRVLAELLTDELLRSL